MASLNRFGCFARRAGPSVRTLFGNSSRNPLAKSLAPIRTKVTRASPVSISSDGLTFKKKPVESNVLSTISQDDYVKMASTETSMNLFKVGAASAGAIAAAPFLMTVVDPMVLAGTAFVGSFGTVLYSLFQIGAESPTVRYNKQERKHEIVDSPRRRKFVNMFLVAEGVTIAPIVYMAAATEVLLPATLITGGIMAGPIVAAYMNPTKNYHGAGTFAFTALLGSIGLSIGGLIFPSFAAVWHMPEAYIGIGIMSIFNWYDTQLMLDSYHKKELDPTKHGISYTLNFINIWIRVVRIMQEYKKN